MNETLIEFNSNEEMQLKMKIVLFYRSFSIIFIIMGTICNTISALVYSKKKMHQSSYSIYLFGLAIVDLGVTWIGNLRFMLMFTIINTKTGENTVDNYDLFFSNPFDLRETSLVFCRLHRFLTYYLLHCSSCLLCILSIDRFFGVVLVLKSSRFCTVKLAKRVIILTLLFLFIFNIHFLISMGYYETEFDQSLNKTIKLIRCAPDPSNIFYKKFWVIFTWLDASLYSIIPFFIMLICNFSIIFKIIRSRINSKQVMVSQLRRNETLKIGRLGKSLSIASSNIMMPNEKRISIIFLIISFSFLLLTCPISIIEINELIFPNELRSVSKVAIATMFMYMNHIINFFFYCALGPKFRQEVKKLFPNKLLPMNKIHPSMCTTRTRGINGAMYIKNNNLNDLKRLSAAFSYKQHLSTLHYKPKEFLEPGLNPFITMQKTLTNNFGLEVVCL